MKATSTAELREVCDTQPDVLDEPAGSPPVEKHAPVLPAAKVVHARRHSDSVVKLAVPFKPPVPAPRKGLPKPVLWLGAVVLALLVGWVIVKFLFLKAEPENKHKVQQISLVRPPPPPPQPKPPEKPPEPPKIKDELKIDPPKPMDDPKPAQQPDAPPPGPLGVDAQGTGPGDGFGLAGRPGGRDVTLGGGGGGMSTTLFANNVARHIAQELARMGPLRNVEYRVDLRVWLSRDGRVERHEITRSSGDPAVDRMIVDGLSHISALRQTPPENLTQPLRIRVTSADA